MILYIDTTDFNRAIFAVNLAGQIKRKICRLNPQASHKTLAMLAKFLQSVSGEPAAWRNDIVRIVANKGPGSYTGTRVGVTIASALGLALGVPVRFLPKAKFRIT